MISAPNVLYKYCAAKTALAILENRRIRFSKPDTFNDTYDCAPAIALSGKTLLNEIALPEAPIAAAEDFLQKGGLHQVANGSIFVTCFSEAADIELMWAHYADHFRGAVIEFKIPLVENDDCIFDRCKLKAVDYSPTRPNISSIDNSIKENLRYYKSPCWAYEKEWRIILSDSKETNNHIDHQFYPHKIKTVIVSEKATKEHKLSIENKIQELNNQLNLSIGLKEAKRHPTDYKIIIA